MKRGFSLVELSIVLVILGLLTGGILAGQSLIRAAEVRKIGTQVTGYMVAIQTFRDKYFALPGDMTNATSFWGRDNTALTQCAAQPGTASATGTCNGNGDGRVNESSNEGPLPWRHLSLAGLIEGSYDGHHTVPYVAGVNAPAVGNGFWHMFAEGGSAYFGVLPDTRTAIRGYADLLSGEEGWNLDTKMDDGVAGTGTMVSSGPVGANGCINGPVSQTSPPVQYVLATRTKVCRPIFYIQ